MTDSAGTATANEQGVSAELILRVDAVDILRPDIRKLILVAADGGDLPSFTPGSNLAVEWAEGRRNSYSLTGPSIQPDHYAVSVLLEERGRGGSRWMHNLHVGDVVKASRPRSAFAPVLTARHHVLIAGGIGVTPILSHVRSALEWDRSFQVLYAARDGFGAHVNELQLLCGGRLTVIGSAGELQQRVREVLRDQRLGAHVYSCGPRAMIDSVDDIARGLGWPSERIHSEAFGVGPMGQGSPFAAKLGRSGMLIPVPSGTSLLEALLDKGIAVPNLCRQGVCGECKLAVRGGRIDHRDLYLTDEEKSAGHSIMPCVSRAAGDLVELEL